MLPGSSTHTPLCHEGGGVGVPLTHPERVRQVSRLVERAHIDLGLCDLIPCDGTSMVAHKHGGVHVRVE